MTEPPFAVLLAYAAVAALIVGFLKTSIGGGIGLVVTTTLSLMLPPPLALGLLAPLMVLSDPVTVRYYWREWDGRQLRLLLPTLLGGVALGTWLLTWMSDAGIRRAIGGGALSFAIIQLATSRRTRPLLGLDPPWPVGATAGLLTGIASSVAHLGGVVLWLYMLGVRMDPRAMVGTIAALIGCSNLVKFAGYWTIGFVSPSILAAGLLATPVLVAGGWLGYRVNRWLPRRAFELIIIAVAIVGSLRLLLG